MTDSSQKLCDVAKAIEDMAQRTGGELPTHVRELMMDWSAAIFETLRPKIRAYEGPGVSLSGVHTIHYDPRTGNLVLGGTPQGEKVWRGMGPYKGGQLAALLGQDIAEAIERAPSAGSGFLHELKDVQALLSPVTETVVQFTVLHDRPLEEPLSLSDLVYECDDGAFVGGGLQKIASRRLSHGQLDTEAARFGSDAAFFDASEGLPFDEPETPRQEAQR
jgi:hypothetical protein